MTLLADGFRNHLIWTSLNDLGPLIDQAMTLDGLNPQKLEELSRLKSVLSFAGKRLAGADPYLFSLPILESISVALATSATHVRNFISTGNESHLPAANLEADKALIGLAQLNVPLTTEDFVGAKEAAENYRLGFNRLFESIQSETLSLKADIDSFRSQLLAISTETGAIKQQLSTLATEHQKQFEATQDARKVEWGKELEVGKEKVVALVSDYEKELSNNRENLNILYAQLQAEFATLKESTLKSLAQTLETSRTSIDALILQCKETIKVQINESTEFQESLKTVHTDYLEKMKKEFVDSSLQMRDQILVLKNEAETLVGIIGERGVTSGHQKAADEARFATRLWQTVTVSSLIGLIVIAIFIFLPQVAGTFTWESFAGRVFISLTVAALATYAGSQADKYQKIERYRRNLALELKAIGPFIAPLPQDKQDEFRLKIGDRTFGREGENAHHSDEKSPTSVADVISKSKDLSGFATEIMKTTADVLKGK